MTNPLTETGQCQRNGCEEQARVVGYCFDHFDGLLMDAAEKTPYLCLIGGEAFASRPQLASHQCRAARPLPRDDE